MLNQLVNLIILRHGEAEICSPDKLRPLTYHGRQQIHSQCQWLINNGFKADCLLHSPYLRTTETAQIAAEYFSEASVMQESLITPDGHPEIVAELIPNLCFLNILLISHMPMVSYLTSTLLAEKEMYGYPVAALSWLKLELQRLKSDTDAGYQSVIEHAIVYQKLVEAE